MALVKSYSNYVLKSFHQGVSDGTIYERDITTIGGVNSFAKGQTPIYKSSNFIITVRGDNGHRHQLNSDKWKSNDDGDIWTLESIDKLTSEYDNEKDTEIVLKNDYYDFRDFAYYGSLTELFRASVGDVLVRFPGELFSHSSTTIYYTSAYTSDSQRIETSVDLTPSNKKFLLDNPYGIDLHSEKKPIDGKELKFFADDGYKNYTILRGNESGSGTAVSSWSTNVLTDCPKVGQKIATVNVNGISIDAIVGDNGVVYYYTNVDGVHIRPKEEFFTKFYNECDSFEKLLMNYKSTPKFKSTFAVIKEDEYGYYKELETFVFPTLYGDYNLDNSSYGFNSFTSRLAEIGLYYDEKFTDNLYRSMTHESIKNFDWTFTRNFNLGEEDEFIDGGRKIEKALKVFAREFDEIKSYIDGIKSINIITYDERSNLPDYFLTDSLENDGWDVKHVYPYTLTETYANGSVVTNYNQCEQLYCENDGNPIIRHFSQDPTRRVKPYSPNLIKDGTESGYFVTCSNGSAISSGCLVEFYSGGPYKAIKASGSTFVDRDFRGGEKTVIRNRIKSYTSDREYSNFEVGNEFLRRLKLNSRYIWRHKGTIEGIEMILAMFGLKSKRWVDSYESCGVDENSYDYEIVEYISKTEPIEDPWDAVHGMHHFDWVNSTKVIKYDYRSDRKNDYGAQGVNYLSYEGLPVTYDKTKNDDGETRELYPYFDKNVKNDGDPYFQMDGGWLGKRIKIGDGGYNFQFDVDENIVFNTYEEGNNHPIYKETIRDILSVYSVAELLKIPPMSLKEGQVVFVEDMDREIAVIGNETFDIKKEYYEGVIYKYISLIKSNGLIRVGDEYFYQNTIMVYDRYGNEQLYYLDDKGDGYEVKCYLNSEGKISISDGYGTSVCDDMVLFPNTISGYSSYFKIDEPAYARQIKRSDDDGGWEQLSYSSKEYKHVNAIKNYYKGNNPHSGGINYDGGHKYFTYFKKLFKYPYENDLFDERCYEDFYTDLFDGYPDRNIPPIRDYGFKNLIDDDEAVLDYNRYLNEDSKIHFVDKTTYIDDNGNDSRAVMNNKRITIKFNLHRKWFEKEGQCELKYIDDIVMNYLSQLIPSTAIVDIVYEDKKTTEICE